MFRFATVTVVAVAALFAPVRVVVADPPEPAEAKLGIDPIEVRARDNWSAADDRHRIFDALGLPEDTFAGAHGLTLSPKGGEITPDPQMQRFVAEFTDKHLPPGHRIIGMLYLGAFGGPAMYLITEHDHRHFALPLDEPRAPLPIEIAHLPGKTPSNDLLIVTFITHDRDARDEGKADPRDRRPVLPRCIVLRRAGADVPTERDLLVPIKPTLDKLAPGASAVVRDAKLGALGLSLTVGRDRDGAFTATLTGARPGVDVHEIIGEPMRLIDGAGNDVATDDFAVGPDLAQAADAPAPTAQLQLTFPRTALRGLDAVTLRLRFRFRQPPSAPADDAAPPEAAEPDAAAPAAPDGRR